MRFCLCVAIIISVFLRFCFCDVCLDFCDFHLLLCDLFYDLYFFKTLFIRLGNEEWDRQKWGLAEIVHMQLSTPQNAKMQKAVIYTNVPRGKKNKWRYTGLLLQCCRHLVFFVAWIMCVDPGILQFCILGAVKFHFGLFLPTPFQPTPFQFS